MTVLERQKETNEVRIPSFRGYKKEPAQNLEQSTTSEKTVVNHSESSVPEGHNWLGASVLSCMIFGYAMREAIVNDVPIGYLIGGVAGVAAVISHGVWGTYRCEQFPESLNEQMPKRKNQNLQDSPNRSYVLGQGMN